MHDNTDDEAGFALDGLGFESDGLGPSWGLELPDGTTLAIVGLDAQGEPTHPAMRGPATITRRHPGVPWRGATIECTTLRSALIHARAWIEEAHAWRRNYGARAAAPALGGSGGGDRGAVAGSTGAPSEGSGGASTYTEGAGGAGGGALSIIDSIQEYAKKLSSSPIAAQAGVGTKLLQMIEESRGR